MQTIFFENSSGRITADGKATKWNDLIAIPYNRVIRIEHSPVERFITIIYFNGDFDSFSETYGGSSVLVPLKTSARIYYPTPSHAKKKMQDFFYCLTKNVQAFKF